MPSPFPGMNPYLEQDDVWRDFQCSIMPEMSYKIISQARPHFITRIESYRYVSDAITEHKYLEIRELKSRELVTVIEMRSPSNKKPGLDRNQYLARRENLI